MRTSSLIKDLRCVGLVKKRDLRRMPREAFPVHVDAMPAIEIDGLVMPGALRWDEEDNAMT